MHKIKSLFEYFARYSLVLEKLTDESLELYRNEELVLVQGSKNASSSERAAKRTVNSKLRRIYVFLAWYQNCHPFLSAFIGKHDCQITSAFEHHYLGQPYSRGPFRRNGRDLFPLIYRRAGEASKHRIQYEATESDMSALRTFFLQENTEYVAVRNIVMMNLANSSGMRVASLNSLLCSQFGEDQLLRAGGRHIAVCPPVQKFGYECNYDVPINIALQVSAFISDHRAALLEEMGWDHSRTNDHIFISAKDGRSMTAQSVSAIFSHAFSIMGAPFGSGFHSFRRKFVNDAIDQEIIARLKLGLDTGVQSVCTAVSLRVGQTNPDSLGPYVSKRISAMTRR
jgi:hypothetical protein